MKNYISLLLFIGLLSCQATAKHMTAAHPVKQINDLTYYSGTDAHEKHQLDLYLPEDVKNAPILLWIHGGAWAFGDRKQEAKFAQKVAESGVAVAVMSYRLSPALWAQTPKKEGIQHPEHIKDVARAFDWVYQHAAKYGYDQNNIFVSGYSAGGHLSALLALDHRYLKAVGQEVDHIRAAIPMAAAYDMLDYYKDHVRESGQIFADQHVKGVLGPTEQHIIDASPSSYLQHSTIPMLIISESETYGYTKVFEDMVQAAEDEHISFWHIMEETHKSLYFDLQNPESGYRDKLVAYIKKHIVTVPATD